MQLNGVPIERLGEAITWAVQQQLLADQETLRSKIIPEVAHAVLAKALAGTNKAKAVHLGAFKLGWRVVEGPDGADVVNDVLYAGVIELGRRPGRPGPPLEPIVEWVRRKLFADQSRRSGVARSGGKGRSRKSGWLAKVKKLIKRLIKRVKSAFFGRVKRKKGEKKAKQTPEQRESQIMQIAIAIRWKIHHKGTKPRFILRDATKAAPRALAAAVRRYLPTGGAARGTA